MSGTARLGRMVPSRARSGCFYTLQLIDMIRCETGWGRQHTIAVLDWMTRRVDQAIAGNDGNAITFKRHEPIQDWYQMYKGFDRIFPVALQPQQDRQPTMVQQAVTAALLAGHELGDAQIVHVCPDDERACLMVRASVCV